MNFFGVLIFLFYCFLNAECLVQFELERAIFPNRTDDSVITLSGRVVKFNRTTQVFNGELEALIDFDNNVQVGFDLFQMQGNEYRKTPYKVPMENFCDWAKKDKYVYSNFVAHTNLPPSDSCPAMPKGKYYIKNLVVDGSVLPPNFQGKFLAHQKFAHKGKVVDVILIYFEINRYM